MPTQTGAERLESFPFDSRADGYDADGYPVYDRAVGAALLRTVFRQFFTDGVFGTPANALQISKGASGLNITVNPGVFIIRGAMGAVPDGDPMEVQLSATPPQGNIAYGVMLHYDENDSGDIGRSLSIRIVAGDASSNPQPPAPDQTSPGICEYRLGYVTVPSGATDLSGATVTNEKGLAVCPYAAPFDTIDVSAIVEDARNQAQEAVDAFLVYAQQYYDLIASAIDDTTAGYLMGLINDISAASFIDNVTLSLNSEAKAQIKERGVTDTKIAIYSIHQEHLDNILRQKLGLLDPSSWDYDEFVDYVTDLDAPNQAEFIQQNMTSSTIAGWTETQVVQFDAVLKSNAPSSALANILDVAGKPLTYLATVISGINGNHPGACSVLVGRTKTVTFGVVGNKQVHIVGVANRQLTSGGTCACTFMSTDVFEKYGCYANQVNNWPASYSSSNIHNRLNNDILPASSNDLKSAIKEVQVTTTCASSNTGGMVQQTAADKLWLPAASELAPYDQRLADGRQEINPLPNDGSRFQYFSDVAAYQSSAKLHLNGMKQYDLAALRGMSKWNYFISLWSGTASTASLHLSTGNTSAYYAPCFCI